MMEARNSGILRKILLLITICFVDLSALAQHGVSTDTYVFLTDQSNVIKTGGIAGVHETYPIQGLFQLKVDANAAVASFVYVDAFLLSPISSSPPQNLGELFNMTELEGIVVDDLLIEFRGKTADDTNTDIVLKLTFTDDGVRLAGQTIPPPGSADFFIFNVEAFAQKKYGGGIGEPNDPYQIATAEDLMLLGESPDDYDKHFILTADIDLDPNLPGRKVFDRAVIAPDMNDTQSWFQGTPFTGVFDGNNHTISHLTIRGESFLGLFGQIDSAANISDLGLEVADVNGTGSRIASFAGINYGSINRCYSTSMVTGYRYVGGLVGWNRGAITTSYSGASVIGGIFVGGLAGVSSGSITSSHSTGTVIGDDDVGGLVGRNERVEYSDDGRITTSYGSSKVSGIDYFAGGLVGENSGVITTSYSTGDVSGGKMVGGLVGGNGIWCQMYTCRGTVLDCYSRGAVIGNGWIGGLVGRNLQSSITRCYSTGSVTANLEDSREVGGLVGSCWEFYLLVDPTIFWDIEASGQASSADGTGKTTVEMQSASTFLEAGWDFVDETANGKEDIWWIFEGQDYPRLWWERSHEDMLFLVVDDFESYNDLDPEDRESNRIWNTWIDGYEIPPNGSLVSIFDVHFPWHHIVSHGGTKSMWYFYGNSVGISEATANVDNLAIGQDWTIEGVRVLSLWFYGDPDNAPEPMYMALANANGSTAVVYHDNPDAALTDTWIEWRIDLQAFADHGVNLANVNTITLGFGNRTNPIAGGSGEVWFDDIRLYRPAEPEQAP